MEYIDSRTSFATISFSRCERGAHPPAVGLVRLPLGQLALLPAVLRLEAALAL
jgi:hypothetical protein